MLERMKEIFFTVIGGCLVIAGDRAFFSLFINGHLSLYEVPHREKKALSPICVRKGFTHILHKQAGDKLRSLGAGDKLPRYYVWGDRQECLSYHAKGLSGD